MSLRAASCLTKLAQIGGQVVRGVQGVGVVVAQHPAAALQGVLVQVAGGPTWPSSRRSAARLCAECRVSGGLRLGCGGSAPGCPRLGRGRPAPRPARAGRRPGCSPSAECWGDLRRARGAGGSGCPGPGRGRPAPGPALSKPTGSDCVAEFRVWGGLHLGRGADAPGCPGSGRRIRRVAHPSSAQANSSAAISVCLMILAEPLAPLLSKIADGPGGPGVAAPQSDTSTRGEPARAVRGCRWRVGRRPARAASAAPSGPRCRDWAGHRGRWPP